MPLRKTHDYRKRSKTLLEWISRRWLFNIPKSLQTEGLRPLGRLAWVDRSQQIANSIQQSLRSMLEESVVQVTSEAVCHPLDAARPRVVIVASAAGGTGSGCFVDTAYLVRQILRDAGFSDKEVIGILLHSTSRDADMHDLAIANAYLSEIQHFSRPFRHFPGDQACGLTAVTENAAPFRDTYFINLGHGISEPELDTACERVAEHLYRSTTTAAGPLIEKCREQTTASDDKPTGLSLRSFGIHRVGQVDHDALDDMTEHLCQAVLQTWVAEEVPASPHPDAGTPTFHASVRPCDEQVLQGQLTDLVAELALEPDALQSNVRGIVCQQMSAADGSAPNERWLSAYQTQGRDENGADFFDVMAAEIGPHEPDTGSKKLYLPETVAASQISKTIRRLSRELVTQLSTWCQALVDDPQQRVAGACGAASSLIDHFKAVDKHATKEYQNLVPKISELQSIIQTPADKGRNGVREKSIHVTDLCQLRLLEFVLRSVAVYARQVAGDLQPVLDQVAQLKGDLRA